MNFENTFIVLLAAGTIILKTLITTGIVTLIVHDKGKSRKE